MREREFSEEVGLKLRVLFFSFLLCGVCQAQPLKIQTQSGDVELDVELATNEEARRYGLMFRKTLGDKQGMLFIYPNSHPIAMWMKNTYIPLDMLFIDAEGRIVHIHPNAEPRSLKTIASQQPAKAAIEIRGGQAEKLGIRVGDRVLHDLSATQ